MSPDAAKIIQRAFGLQRQGALEAAEALYREALQSQPGHPDCLHMLGVLHLRQEKYLQGIDLIEQACIAGQWRSQVCFSNLVLGLAHFVATFPEPANVLALKNSLVAERAKQAAARSSDRTPLVSVVIPSYNHAKFIRAALQSVFLQTYRPLELIVVDDGSTDSSSAIIRDELSRCAIPHQYIARDNRGAHATINEGIALATGTYINVLNSDDLFVPNRIGEMVRAIHRCGAEWGFSRCALIADDGTPVAETENRARAIRTHLISTQNNEEISHLFLRGNPAISSGNIFASKSLIRKVGGFSDHRYNHDWDFCLNASWYSEPVAVDAELYCYRLHDRNTISQGGSRAAHEADTIVSNYCQRAERQVPINPLALCKATFPAKFVLAKLMHMRGAPKSSEGVRQLVQEIRDQYHTFARCSPGMKGGDMQHP